MTADPFDLERFVKAQELTYSIALDEVTKGRKQSHWVWFILPQLRWLGRSEMAHKFGISGMAEAQAYMAHPLLGPRLVEVVQAIRQHKASTAEDVLGDTDARKFHSCLTQTRTENTLDPNSLRFSCDTFPIGSKRVMCFILMPHCTSVGIVV